MKKKVMMGVLSLLASALGGCSEINATPADPNLTRFDGVWDVLGKTAVSHPEAAEDCGYGTGTGRLTIKGSTITGELQDDSGYDYVVEGNIDARGRMTGGFTYEGYDAATFEGTLGGRAGMGSWQDIYGCPGSWEVHKGSWEVDKQEAAADSVPPVMSHP
ncbi:MAG: hypothetical protein ACT4QB_18275 [Gammaproteobacteria bacterium]